MHAEVTLLRDMFCTLVRSMSCEIVKSKLTDDEVVRKGFRIKCEV